MVERRKRGPVEQAVWRELAKELRPSGLGQAAMMLARRVDASPEDRDAAVLVRELRATLVELRKVAPAVSKKDQVDDLNARRAARRGA